MLELGQDVNDDSSDTCCSGLDGTGFVVSALWNPWASASSKGGDFTMVLLSQAAVGAVSALTMPLAMARINARGRATKKQA